MPVTIVDYGSGNLHSAKKAFERAALQMDCREDIVSSNDPDIVRNSSRIVLPGVGAFADCRAGIEKIPGLQDALSEAVIARGVPFLGICVGMQLLATTGHEHHMTPGFDWISGEVLPLSSGESALKVPHMGWNTLNPIHAHPLLQGIPLGEDGLHAYFVHSFHFEPTTSDLVLTETQYGEPFASVVGRNNIVGTQFHPEKSQRLGLAFIANFLRWRP